MVAKRSRLRWLNQQSVWDRLPDAVRVGIVAMVRALGSVRTTDDADDCRALGDALGMQPHLKPERMVRRSRVRGAQNVLRFALGRLRNP